MQHGAMGHALAPLPNGYSAIAPKNPIDRLW